MSCKLRGVGLLEREAGFAVGGLDGGAARGLGRFGPRGSGVCDARGVVCCGAVGFGDAGGTLLAVGLLDGRRCDFGAAGAGTAVVVARGRSDGGAFDLGGFGVVSAALGLGGAMRLRSSRTSSATGALRLARRTASAVTPLPARAVSPRTSIQPG